VLRTVGQGQVAEVGQILEEQADIKVLQLSDNQAEHLVSGGVQLAGDFCGAARRSIVLKQSLDVRFNVSLLETVSMLFALDVLILHIFALQALLLPIELEVDVASDSCDRQFLISQFHNFTLD